MTIWHSLFFLIIVLFYSKLSTAGIIGGPYRCGSSVDIKTKRSSFTGVDGQYYHGAQISLSKRIANPPAWNGLLSDGIESSFDPKGKYIRFRRDDGSWIHDTPIYIENAINNDPIGRIYYANWQPPMDDPGYNSAPKGYQKGTFSTDGHPTFEPFDPRVGPDLSWYGNWDGRLAGGVFLYVYSNNTDNDDDGVPNSEDAFIDDPSETLDTDGDGLGDNYEAANGLNLNVADTDGDGMADGWEVVNGLAPLDPSDKDLDSDADGASNLEEFNAGTNNSLIDTDGDNVRDGDDAFPTNSRETADSDSDGVGDNSDRFPLDPSETKDSDGDGVGDNSDDLPNNPDETVDSDSDGVGDNSDAYPNNPAESADTDGDGVGDNVDNDDDGDGVNDADDRFPLDNTESVDSDSDGVGDNADDFPNDPNLQTKEVILLNSNGARHGFPRRSTLNFRAPEGMTIGLGSRTSWGKEYRFRSADRGGNGDTGRNEILNIHSFIMSAPWTSRGFGEMFYEGRDGSNWNHWNMSYFAYALGTPLDSDGDGVADDLDWAPADPAETVDSDGDGVGNNADKFPNDPSETVDSDDDGVGDNADDLPNDPSETVDSDSDGVGDIADTDDDNDSITDENDAFPLDRTESADSDSDGIGDNAEILAGTDPSDYYSKPHLPGLIHLWSFSETGGAGTSLYDSIGGAHGVLEDVGSRNGVVADGAVTLSGGSKIDADYVKLPANLLNGLESATIETWATQLSVQNWSRIFSVGISESNVLFFSFSRGTNVNTNRLKWLNPGSADLSLQDFGGNPTNPIGQQVHWAITFEGNAGAEGETKVTIYKDAKEVTSVYQANKLSDLLGVEFNLGRSFFNDHTANASWDEFRIYDRAHSLTAIEQSYRVGPDALHPDDTIDTDQDGVSNYRDADDDNDGVADDLDWAPLDASETADTDGDGTGDNADAFPADPNEVADSDQDGTGDNGDWAPQDPTEIADSDGDGVGDNADAFPADPSETTDTDRDLIGNNSDPDDDNDGVNDNQDPFPLDSTETVDTDRDGTGDNADTDDDNDGIADGNDAFPKNPSETVDTDQDGIGNNADRDDDNDGLSDALELVSGGNPLIGDDVQVTLDYISSFGLNLFSEDQYNAINAERDALQNDKASLNTQVTTLAAAVRARDVSIVTLEGEKTTLAGQVATLNETVAARDMSISELSQRPTQARYDDLEDALVAMTVDRDARPTLAEVQDARVGSIILSKDWESGEVSLCFGLQKTEDFVTWEAFEGGTWSEAPNGEFKLNLPLGEAKKWLRLTMPE